ncbi:MAG: hypothetical protein KDB22_03065 [Planctomycetales bacterium]|nr:hypothetical protein [Planctomycetales bacterium]
MLNRNIDRPLLAANWLAGAVIVLGAWQSFGVQTAVAAGCHSGDDVLKQTLRAGEAGIVAQWHTWSSGPVQRLYVDGKIMYLQLLTANFPCDGPNCRGSDRPQHSTSSVMVPPTRNVVAGVCACEMTFAPEITAPAHSAFTLRHSSPVLPSPFEPPRS